MMNDEKLFLLCQRYGAAALEARRKFAGLLPEVYRRKLYEKKGFSSIFEFAAKLSGMSEEQVRRVLQLERKFKDKPALKRALVFGHVSVHKLARVASIATIENQEELAEKAKLLSQPALEVLVRDEKSVRSHTDSQQSLLNVNLLDHLSPEVQKNLIERLKKGININHLLTELLQKHDLELAQEKAQLSKEACERERLRREDNPATTGAAASQKSAAKPHAAASPEGSSAAAKPSRYISVKNRRKKFITLKDSRSAAITIRATLRRCAKNIIRSRTRLT